MSYLFFLILAILLEATVISIPIVLDVLLVYFILSKKSRLLIFAFVAGIILDILRIRVLGLTSIFFMVFILLVFLYEKKFEIATYPFVFFAAFLGGILYLLMLNYSYVLEQAVMGALIAAILFKLLNNIKNQKLNIKNTYQI